MDHKTINAVTIKKLVITWLLITVVVGVRYQIEGIDVEQKLLSLDWLFHSYS